VDQSLFCKILSCFPNLCRLVIVLDPWQINAISPGTPCKDLIELFPRHVHRLTRNMRVAPDAMALAAANMSILSGNVRNIAWTHGLELGAPISLAPRPDVPAIVRHMHAEWKSLKLDTLCAFECAFQFATLKQKVRRVLNEQIQQELVDMGVLHPPPEDDYGNLFKIGKKMVLFAGMKIRFEQRMAYQPPNGNKRKKDEKVPYDEVRNGELGYIMQVRRNQRTNKTELVLQDPLAPSLGTKTILLDATEHVDPNKITLAWALSINSTQGSQFPLMAVYFHEGFESERDSFTKKPLWTREFLYVGVSRARFRTVVATESGGLDALEVMVQETAPPRDTSLMQQVKQLMPKEAYEVSGKRTLSADHPVWHPEKCKVMTLKRPCVPVL
jgi:ATP-dependent exoDNAse (exonuclease V) alpha subunit